MKNGLLYDLTTMVGGGSECTWRLSDSVSCEEVLLWRRGVWGCQGVTSPPRRGGQEERVRVYARHN